ncbi:lysophospholipid acyltransferase family protein [Paucimonas lemoignei]|nr:lysophospholipid acyltransferase family protein [Paucimonas lemoignei]
MSLSNAALSEHAGIIGRRRMTALRLARLCLHLLAGLLTCALLFSLAGETGRSRLIRRWSVKLLALCRVQVEMVDPKPDAPVHALVVANHISWLDIFVINSWTPCQFVAKSDIRGWPLLGWLCDKAGTIFIERGNLRAVRRIYEGLVHRLQAGERVAFFPEGTTAEQGKLLPFHSNLFESAVEAQVPIQPVVLRYLRQDGRYHPSVTFVGDMTFVDSMLTILKGEKIRAELVRLPLIETAGRHRRELAQLAQDAIASELAIEPERRAA